MKEQIAIGWHQDINPARKQVADVAAMTGVWTAMVNLIGMMIQTSTTDQPDVLAIRHALELDRLTLAQELGVSQRTIYRWEDGDTDLHPIWQDRLTKLFKQRWPRRQVPMLSMRDDEVMTHG